MPSACKSAIRHYIQRMYARLSGLHSAHVLSLNAYLVLREQERSSEVKKRANEVLAMISSRTEVRLLVG